MTPHRQAAAEVHEEGNPSAALRRLIVELVDYSELFQRTRRDEVLRVEQMGNGRSLNRHFDLYLREFDRFVGLLAKGPHGPSQ